MKKSFIMLMIVAVLIGTLFISCSNDAAKDELGSVSLMIPSSRSLTAATSSSVTEVGDLYWYYSASKTSGLYATGQTSGKMIGETKGGLVKDAVLGAFSSGGWKFSFYGFVEKLETSATPSKDAAVYYAEDIAVTVIADDTVAIPVTLTVGNAAAGQIILTSLSLDLSSYDFVTGGTLSLSVKCGDTEILTGTSGAVSEAKSYSFTLSVPEGVSVVSLSDDVATYSPTSTGALTLTFIVKYTLGNETIEVANESKTITIANGINVTITGNVTNTDSQGTVILGTITGSGSSSAEIETNTVQTAFSISSQVSPASVDSLSAPASTVVEFAAGSITASEDNDVSYRLDTDVKGVVEAQTAVATAAPTFSVETAIGADKSVVAAIDLSLFEIKTENEVETKTTTTLSSSASVTITTYIAKGLSNVSVKYTGDGAQPTDVSYDATTGLLTFKTTHFSTFAVAADEVVYDKTSNTAYKLTSAGLLDGATFDNTHEYVLLDSTEANAVSDEIDVFNAGKSNWSVVHARTDAENKTDFAGGYGTKIEPYLISNITQMQNIAKQNSSYSYYKVKEADAVFTATANWKSIEMIGSFDGNGVTFKNLPDALFEGVSGIKDANNNACIKNIKIDNVHMVRTGYYNAPVVCWTEYLNTFTVDNVQVSGYSESDIVTGFVGWSEASHTIIKNSESSLTLVSTGNQVSGFVGNSLGVNTVTVIDSIFNGSEVSTGNTGSYLYAHNNGNCTLELSYTDEFKNSHSGLYDEFTTKANASTNVYSIHSKISKTTIDIPEECVPLTVTKDSESVRAVATYVIGVNPGNFTRVYQKDTIDLSNVTTTTFTTEKVKRYAIVINDGVHGNEAVDNVQYISDSSSNGTYHCVVFTVIQYKEDGTITSIRTTMLPGNENTN